MRVGSKVAPPRWLSRSFAGLLVNALTPSERRIVLALGSVVLVSIGLLLWQQRSPTNQPTEGGRYVEGVVATSLADVEPTVQALTHVGLLHADRDGSLTGLLAESWTVSDDAKRFEFILKQSVDRSVVLAAFDPTVPESPFSGTTVEPFDDRGVRIQLNESYRPFIASFTKPLVPVGPFVVTERTKEAITLRARADYLEGRPRLKTVVLQIFPTTTGLERSLHRGTLDGVALVPPELTLPDSFIPYELSLPRKTAAFFNLERSALESKAVRTNLSDRATFESPLTLDVVTTETLATNPAVRQLLEDWHNAKVDVHLQVLPAARVQKEVIPSRNYDVLIFGIDEGVDPDPYLFWHSSQRKPAGLNLSNFADVDADQLLEAARTTGKADEHSLRDQAFTAILDRERPWLVIDDSPWRFAASKRIVGPADHAGFTPTDRFSTIHTWFRR